MSVLTTKGKARTMNVNSIKKIFDQANDLMEDNNHSENVSELINLRETTNDRFERIKTLDDEISVLIDDAEELQINDDLAIDFTLSFKRENSKINKFLNKFSIKSNDDASSTVTLKTNKMVKLPTLKIEAFDGNLENWQSFWENFDCAINKNDELSNIQKMTYLRNLIHGQAYSAINGLSLSNENYTIALDILKQRFSNKQLTVFFYMKKLLKLDRLNNIKNVNLLRKLLDTIEIQIRSLENIGIDSSMYGSILVPITLDKLPEELNLIISRKLNEDETWNIKDVFNILKAELRAREHINSSDLNTLLFTASTFHSSNNSSNKYDKRNFNYN
ncbi:uncharacterized protein LOC136094543 [Hydra vulgaris]|uniref:uncharacterized protein LOC136094543 n=1 Tax=Hydra vulgaris TaxID=6087 RepID=UPI0032EA866C